MNEIDKMPTGFARVFFESAHIFHSNNNDDLNIAAIARGSSIHKNPIADFNFDAF